MWWGGEPIWVDRRTGRDPDGAAVLAGIRSPDPRHTPALHVAVRREHARRRPRRARSRMARPPCRRAPAVHLALLRGHRHRRTCRRPRLAGGARRRHPHRWLSGPAHRRPRAPGHPGSHQHRHRVGSRDVSDQHRAASSSSTTTSRWTTSSSPTSTRRWGSFPRLARRRPSTEHWRTHTRACECTDGARRRPTGTIATIRAFHRSSASSMTDGRSCGEAASGTSSNASRECRAASTGTTRGTGQCTPSSSPRGPRSSRA